MASNSTISIGFRVVDAGNGLQTLTMNANDLRQILRANVEESQRLQRNFVDFAAVCTSIDSVSNTLNSLKSVVDNLAGAYDIQIEAETRLEQVMRNTMGATQEQIQSIKDFCSAQQQIGVVGDEVQLAGAQELATYVTMEGSLKRLIPVMNDMLVQQYGLAASGEAAAQIAGMLGKVLDGQTGALSRYGYKFDEAQEKMLKYGTEEERVATLTEVVSQSLGGMNQAMARTESGRMQQMANTLGDVKEQLGGIVKSAQAPLTIAANATIALGGIRKLISGLQALNKVLNLTKVASGWIGLALTAVASVIAYLCYNADKAAKSLDNAADAEERAARASEMAAEAAQTEADARKAAESSLEYHITKTKTFNGTKEEEEKLVTELNNTYGRTMGYFSTVAEWYQTLIKNSKAYCDQMVNEAKARTLANQIAELELSRRNIIKDDKGNTRKYSKEQEMQWRVVTPEEEKQLRAEGKTVSGRHVGGKYIAEAPMPVAGTSDLEKAQAAYNDFTGQITNLRSELEKTQATKIEMPVMGSPEPPAGGTTNTHRTGPASLQKPETQIPAGSIADYKKQIADIQKKITFSINPDETLRLEQQKMELEKKITELEIPVKIAHSAEKFEEDWKNIKPIEIPVKIDASSLDASLKDLPKGTESIKDMKKTLGDVSGLIDATGEAFSGMGKAFEMPELDVMGIIAGSIATMIQGYAAATSTAGASLGPIGWAAFGLSGLAQLMTMISQVKAAVPFANGGIVSGPTYALVGEYAGASSNPEVIAPLDKLRDIIGSGQPAAPVIVGGRVEIDGRKLAVVLENQSRIASVSGRKYR